MSTQIQRRRGTTAQHASFTGAVGETTIDTDKEVVVVHDGVQVGGYPQMRENGSNSALALGSAGTPSLKFTGDTNTGIYSPGADQVAISTGGSGRLFVDSNGNLGVGISSIPNYNVNLRTVSFNNTNGVVHDYAVSGTRTGSLVCQSTGFEVSTQTAIPLIFSTNSSEKMRITSAGLVGIGTSSPRSLFNLAASATSGTILTVENTNTDLTAGQYIGRIQFYGNDSSASSSGVRASIDAAVADAGGGTDIVFSNSKFIDSTLYERLRIDSLGRVGIGVTSPSQKLHLSESGATALYQRFQNSNGDCYIGLLADGNSVISADSLNNELVFKTQATERSRIDKSGRLLVGTSSALTGGDTQYSKLVLQGNTAGATGPAFLAIARGETAATTASAGQTIGRIVFSDSAAGQYATIGCETDAAVGNNDYPSRLVFSTTLDSASSPTERMRIRNNGTIWIATGGNAPSSTVTGLEFHYTGYIYAVTSGAAVGYFNRNTSDGTLLEFRRDDAAVGTISVSGGTVSYNPFLGSHWGRLPDNQKTDILVGTILETVDQLIEWKVAVFEVEGENKMAAYNGSAGVGETVEIEYEGETYEALIQYEEDPTSDLNKHVCVKVNDTAGSKAVFGVFLGWDNDLSKGVIGTWNDMYCAAVGNYFVRMAASQEPEIGDLVEADGTGCGVVQDDDIIRTKTVAKITSTIPQVTYDDGSFLVTCVLCCG